MTRNGTQSTDHRRRPRRPGRPRLDPHRRGRHTRHPGPRARQAGAGPPLRRARRHHRAQHRRRDVRVRRPVRPARTTSTSTWTRDSSTASCSPTSASLRRAPPPARLRARVRRRRRRAWPAAPARAASRAHRTGRALPGARTRPGASPPSSSSTSARRLAAHPAAHPVQLADRCRCTSRTSCWRCARRSPVPGSKSSRRTSSTAPVRSRSTPGRPMRVTTADNTVLFKMHREAGRRSTRPAGDVHAQAVRRSVGFGHARPHQPRDGDGGNAFADVSSASRPALMASVARRPARARGGDDRARRTDAERHQADAAVHVRPDAHALGARQPHGAGALHRRARFAGEPRSSSARPAPTPTRTRSSPGCWPQVPTGSSAG